MECGGKKIHGCDTICIEKKEKELCHVTPADIIRNNGSWVDMVWRKSGDCYYPNSLEYALQCYLDEPDKYAPPIVKVTDSHFAVVVGRGDGVYITYDPAYGKRFPRPMDKEYTRIIQYYIP